MVRKALTSSRAGDPQLDDVAREINAICRTATLDLAYRVGAFIIERLFDGNLHLWKADGSKRPSFRELAQRGDLLLSASALCRSVAIYELGERVGGRAFLRNLGSSHLQEVLPLGPGEQERLIRVAETERWTVARMRAEVIKRLPERRPRGRRTLSRTLKTVLQCSALVGGLGGEPEGSLVDDLDDKDRAELVSAIKGLRRDLLALHTALGCREDEIDPPTGGTRPSYVRELGAKAG